MGISALVAFALPFALFFFFRCRKELRLRNVFVGAGIFVVFVVVLEASMHAYLLTGNPATKAWFESHTLGFAIYAALAAALFEETGRFIGLRFLTRSVPGDGTPDVDDGASGHHLPRMRGFARNNEATQHKTENRALSSSSGVSLG